jgi:radical SAM modification target selenobiotic family peptide
MDFNDLKKILAGLTIAALISGSALTLQGCKTTEHSQKKDEMEPSSETEVKRKFPHGGPTGQA